MRRSRFIFHPVCVLVCAALSMAMYAAAARWRFAGADLRSHFIYMLPLIVPCVAFMFDRGALSRTETWPERVTDFTIIVTAMLRALGVIPLISGHVLFLTYAIVRPGSRLTKITALLVLLQVLYLKIFVWHDLVTPGTGIAAGLAAALIVRGLGARVHAQPLQTLPNNE